MGFCGLLGTTLFPVRFAEVVRAHWGVENSLHWVLGVTMNEDQNRSRKDNGPQKIALSRCLPQVDHEPAHGTWICGSARSSMVGKAPTQRGADLAIRPPFLQLINSDQ
jgi:hypothetical protein